MTAFRTKPPKGSSLRRGDPLAKGMLHAWLFNEGAGLTAHDSAGGKRGNGTLTNFPTPQTSASGWNPTPCGRGLVLDGTNDCVDFAAVANTGIGSAFTLAALLRFDAIGSTQVPFSVGNSILVNVSASDLRWQQDAGGFPNCKVTTTRTAGTWYHVVVVSTGSGAGNTKIYLNGARADNGADAGTLQAGTFQIGRQVGGVSGARAWAGAVAFASIHSRAIGEKLIRDWAADPFRPFRPSRSFAPAAAPPATNRRRRVLCGSR